MHVLFLTNDMSSKYSPGTIGTKDEPLIYQKYHTLLCDEYNEVVVNADLDS